MEFNKTKVYTPFNCDKVKIGSKGYVSDYYESLKDYVEGGFNNSRFGTLVYNDGKFRLENNNTSYQLFYLIEEPTKRPCTKEELLEMLKKQGLQMVLCKDNDFTYSIIRLNGKKLQLCLLETLLSLTITKNFVMRSHFLTEVSCG